MVFLVLPSFCHHVLDAYTDYLRLPAAFTRHLRRVSAKRVNFRGPSGRIWVVMLARIEATEEVLFDRGWLDFLRDHFVTAGHILLFTYLGIVDFKIEFFQEDGCPKDVFCRGSQPLAIKAASVDSGDTSTSSSGFGAGSRVVFGVATAASYTASAGSGAVGASSTGASSASGTSVASYVGSGDSGDSSGDAGSGGVVVPDKNTRFLTHLFLHLRMGRAMEVLPTLPPD
ncbi:hypothetical protein J5N97_026250 [Dioscorea zingiberensis]|uniref:TF-B3 domain-containing protein n=1 Tax=Dioscorea zingiberensis TaxID=325984 RepID=A0A9D5C367_9LILI|nr:hypothetical protein J5N97_026250 [Dioscorea zingiberensis]